MCSVTLLHDKDYYAMVKLMEDAAVVSLGLHHGCRRVLQAGRVCELAISGALVELRSSMRMSGKNAGNQAEILARGVSVESRAIADAGGEMSGTFAVRAAARCRP